MKLFIGRHGKYNKQASDSCHDKWNSKRAFSMKIPLQVDNAKDFSSQQSLHQL
jgi:hypothetical protein